MSREVTLYLEDIRDACKAIARFTESADEESFLTDAQLQSAVCWQLATLGEAVTQLRRADVFVARRITDHDEIINLRNRLVHAYFTLKLQVVWNIVTEHVPLLQSEALALLADASTSSDREPSEAALSHEAVAAPVRESVLQLLTRIERQRRLRVLFACESGSRAWGFASSDSDYDVRFIYAYRPAEYVGLKAPVGAFDQQEPGDIDLGGWDIRKTAELMRRSNPPLMEWLASPIIYRAESAPLASLRQLARWYFDPLKAAHHYLSMARNVWKGHLESEPQPVRKKYLYALRPLACIRYIALHRAQPPTAFAQVLAAIDWPREVMDAVHALVRDKRAGVELGRGHPDVILNRYISRWLNEGDAVAAALPTNDRDNEALDRFVADVIFHT